MCWNNIHIWRWKAIQVQQNIPELLPTTSWTTLTLWSRTATLLWSWTTSMWRLLTGERKLFESRQCRQVLTYWSHISLSKCLFFQVENYVIQVEKLKQCLEDITSVCILEGFQKQVLQQWLGNISGHTACRSIWWWWIVCWRSLGGQRLALLLETGLNSMSSICFAPNPCSNQATSYDVSTFHPTVLHFLLWRPGLEVSGKGWTFFSFFIVGGMLDSTFF